MRRVRDRGRYGRVTSTFAWAKARAAAKQRDGGCRYADGTCHGQLQVHHLLPVAAGGAEYDLQNLVTLCRRHHSKLEGDRRRTHQNPN